MTKQEVLAKLNSVVSTEKSQWFEQAQYREDNYKDIKKAQKIALLVLRTIRARKMSQVALAEKMNTTPQLVNKWLKGKENFTLSTIEKLEEALGIQLMQITDPIPEYKILNSSKLTIKRRVLEISENEAVNYNSYSKKSTKTEVKLGLTRSMVAEPEDFYG